jgi:uncharacterized protein YegJ (DUF2314 family)
MMQAMGLVDRGHLGGARAALCAVIALLPGCDRSDRSMEGSSDSGNAREKAASAWATAGDGAVVAVDLDSQAAIDTAVAEARRTAGEARLRWESSPESARLHWAVKWAAETDAGGVEYVWVRPEHWSAFRVEGILLNQPRAQLACGRAQGDAVAFASESLADWMYESQDAATGEVVRLGGFTVKVLAQKFGAPPAH